MKQEPNKISHKQRIEAISRLYPDFVGTLDNKGNYHKIFRDACGRGYIEVAEHLLAITDGEFKEQMIHADNDLALIQTAKGNHIDVVKLLLNETQNPTLKNQMIHCFNDALFRTAADNGYIDMLKLLLNETQDPTLKSKMIHAGDDEAFKNAAKGGYINILELLLTETLDPESRNKMIHAGDNSAFRMAAGSGHIDVLKFLLNQAEDPELKKQMIHAKDNLAFTMAANGNHAGVFKFLLENIEDMEIRHKLIDSYGERVLSLAAQQQNSECFEFFLLHVNKEKIPELIEKVKTSVSRLIKDNIDNMVDLVGTKLEVIREVSNFIKISKDPFKDMQDSTGLPPEITADILHKSLKAGDKISANKALHAAVTLQKINEDAIKAKKYTGSQEEENPIKNIKAKTKFIEIYGKLREEKESKSNGRERS